MKADVNKQSCLATELSVFGKLFSEIIPFYAPIVIIYRAT